MNAHERHQRWIWEQKNIYKNDKLNDNNDYERLNDIDLIKRNQKFLKDEDLYDDDDELDNDDDDDTRIDQRPTTSNSMETYNQRLTDNYYNSLFKEFAMSDLKHFKSGRISLRWRTSDEVLSGKGESTCSNLRCLISNEKLSTFHLPFTYEEENIVKSTDVKIKVCKKCSKKLNYKSDLKKKKAREEVSYESRRRKYE